LKKKLFVIRTLTVEGIYRDGIIEIPDSIKFEEPMRVLVLFLEELLPKKPHEFSFSQSLEITKDCKGKLSDVVIDERRTEKWL
jgi:hypothetical protein